MRGELGAGQSGAFRRMLVVMSSMTPLAARRIIQGAGCGVSVSLARRMILFATLGLVLATSPAAVANEPVRLEYEGTIDDATAGLVDMRLRVVRPAAVVAEPFELVLPERFAFVGLPEPRLVDEIAVWAPSVAGGHGVALPVVRLAPYHWRLGAEGHREFLVEWTVPLDHRTLPEVAGRDEYEHPYLAEDHGLLVAGALFLVPPAGGPGEDGAEPRLHIRVRFRLPAGWGVVAPWPEGKGGEFLPAGRQTLMDDLIAVGQWSTHALATDRLTATVAFAPGQVELEQAVVPLIGRIVTSRSYSWTISSPTDWGRSSGSRSRSRSIVCATRRGVSGASRRTLTGVTVIFRWVSSPNVFALWGSRPVSASYSSTPTV